MEELKKQIRTNDLTVMAGRKRQSPRTGFIHDGDLIPLYENFCFAFSLFRQKTTESVTEGKELIGRLLAFESEGNFPLFLHDYPRCFDFQMPLKVAPLLIYLLRLFSPVLGDLKPKIEQFLTQLKATEKPGWENRYRACKNLPLLPVETTHFSAAEWTEWLITAQLSGETHFAIPYDEQLQLLLSSVEVQEKGEPSPNPVEWILADGSFSPRLLKDHPSQLLCAPLFPFDWTPRRIEQGNLSRFSLLWEGSVIHSLVGKGLVFDLEEIEFGKSDLFEALLYTNISPEKKILVNGSRATSFRLGDQIAIQTDSFSVSLKFLLTQGSGDFCGHIFRSNRPSQIMKGYEAYDWQIGLRTLRRSPRAQIQIELSK